MADLDASELRRLIDDQCDVFEEAWDGGNRPAISDFLEAVPDSGRGDLIGELLALELELRVRAGESPQLAAYKAQYSGHEDRVEQAFEELQSWAESTDVLDETAKSQIIQGDHDTHRAGPPIDPPSPDSGSSQTLDQVGAYDILERIGQGGMGVVYKARDTRLKRIVALKMMLAAGQAGRDELARFRLEAEAVARLQHPNIVQVHEVGEHQGHPYISLEFVDGPDMTAFAGGEPQPSRLAAEIVKSLAAAMHYAHSQGVVHRDLKPANILLARGAGSEYSEPSTVISDQSGSTERKTSRVSVPATVDIGPEETREIQLPVEPTADKSNLPPQADTDSNRTTDSSRDAATSSLALTPKITDFGLAKRVDTQSELTHSGAIVGTPQYMAPEQASGANDEISPLADVYSLGAILYYLVTGRPPFHGASPLETLMMVRNELPPPPTMLLPHLSKDIETICLKCLDKDPGRRFDSAGELAEELGRFLRGEPILARPVGRLERSWRWCRRNPLAAGLAAGCIALFVIGFAGVTFAWREAYANYLVADIAQSLAVQRQEEAERANLAAQDERNAAVAAKLARQRQTSRLLFQRGLSLCAEGETGKGVLWLAESLKAAANEDADQAWRRVVRSNLGGWCEQVDVLRHRLNTPKIIYALRCSTDGKTVVAAGMEGEILRFDIETGEQIGQVVRLGSKEIGWSAVWGLAFHPQANWFLAGAGRRSTVAAERNGILQRFDGDTGEPIGDPIHLPFAVNQIVFSPKGDQYAVQLFDRDYGAELLVYQTEGDRRLFGPIESHFISRIGFSHDGALLRYTMTDRDKQETSVVLTTNDWAEAETDNVDELTFWNPADHFVRHDPIFQIPYQDVSPEFGNAIVMIASHVGIRDLTCPVIRPRRPPGRQSTTEFDWHYRVALSPSCETVLKGSDDGKSYLIDSATGAWRADPLRQGGRVLAVAFSPDETLCATGGNNVQIWDAKTGKPHSPLLIRNVSISALQFSPNGRTLAVGDYASAVTLWDVETGELIQSPLSQGDIVTTIAFSPDGRRLLVGTASDWNHDPKAVLWDLESGQPIGQPMRHAHYVRHVEFSSNGERMLTASSDATVRLWNPRTAEPVGAVIPFSREPAPVHFSPDSSRVITGDLSGEVRAWSATTGQPIANAVYLGPARVTALASSKDGSHFAVGYENGESQLFDASEFRPLGPQSVQRGAIKQIGLSDNGLHWTSVTVDGSARTWTAPVALTASPDSIVRRLQGDTSFQIDANQLCVSLTAEQWRDKVANRSAPQSPRLKTKLAWHRAQSLDAEEDRDWVGAEWHLTRLVDASPDDWLLRARLARTRVQSGDLEGAAAEYANARRLSVEDSNALSRWFRQIADSAMKQSKWSEARWYLDQLIEQETAKAADNGTEDWRLYAHRAAVLNALDLQEARSLDVGRVLQLCDSPTFLLSYADEVAGQENWPSVVNLFGRATSLGAIPLTRWHQYSLALLRSGDADTYRANGTTLVATLTQRELAPSTAASLAWLCAVGPSDPEDASRLIPIVENILSTLPPESGSQRYALGLCICAQNRLSRRSNGWKKDWRSSTGTAT